jgi:LysM repeat protein
VDPRTRRELTRYGAPAAFLAAVTIAVLLVKAGLNGGSTETVGALPTASPTTTRQTATTTTSKLVLSDVGTTITTSTTVAGAQYYVIQSGDTLGSIAARYKTTVDELLRLNPGIDPSALHPGDRIRVS